MPTTRSRKKNTTAGMGDAHRVQNDGVSSKAGAAAAVPRTRRGPGGSTATITKAAALQKANEKIKELQFKYDNLHNHFEDAFHNDYLQQVSRCEDLKQKLQTLQQEYDTLDSKFDHFYYNDYCQQFDLRKDLESKQQTLQEEFQERFDAAAKDSERKKKEIEREYEDRLNAAQLEKSSLRKEYQDLLNAAAKEVELEKTSREQAAEKEYQDRLHKEKTTLEKEYREREEGFRHQNNLLETRIASLESELHKTEDIASLKKQLQEKQLELTAALANANATSGRGRELEYSHPHPEGRHLLRKALGRDDDDDEEHIHPSERRQDHERVVGFGYDDAEGAMLSRRKERLFKERFNGKERAKQKKPSPSVSVDDAEGAMLSRRKERPFKERFNGKERAKQKKPPPSVSVDPSQRARKQAFFGSGSSLPQKQSAARRTTPKPSLVDQGRIQRQQEPARRNSFLGADSDSDVHSYAQIDASTDSISPTSKRSLIGGPPSPNPFQGIIDDNKGSKNDRRKLAPMATQHPESTSDDDDSSVEISSVEISPPKKKQHASRTRVMDPFALERFSNNDQDIGGDSEDDADVEETRQEVQANARRKSSSLRAVATARYVSSTSGARNVDRHSSTSSRTQNSRVASKKSIRQMKEDILLRRRKH